ncbi:hypothetical protein [Aestuariibaculum marinum]|uniref:Uncharacterized protein n=1 Tax=Aestuariibaculum marinum TaxID=2683592 RepID=A0A8J6PNW6_9FLAO|nr:hypothetical protein [Aestuariibaculum marinum]MBD0822634.1 hypothetical protein [Aestuariibaculum marinum]
MLKEKLKKALKEAGLNEELAESINITSESQIEGIVISLQSTQNNPTDPDFNQILGSQQFADFVAKTGFDNVIKLAKPLQSEHDKKVTAGIKTFQEKWLKKANGETEEEDEDGKQPTGDNAVLSYLKKLESKIEEMEKSKTQTTKLDQAKAIIAKSTVLTDALKEKWMRRIDLESETSFEDQVKELENEYQEMHTSIVGDSSGKGLPTGGKGKNEASDEEVGSLVNDLI